MSNLKINGMYGSITEYILSLKLNCDSPGEKNLIFLNFT